MAWRVPLAEIEFGAEEQAAIQRVLEGRWLTMGAVTEAFETEFAHSLGANHAIAVANGTAALHLACLAVGLGPGDEVIVPALTFVATVAAIRYTGATPVFADIQSEADLTISPASINAGLTDRTRAILVMHYGGYPCDMPEIMTMARRRGVAVIEDAAHAPGASLEGRSLGTWGDVGCFSFFSNKNLVTGEGGMLVINNEGIAQRARLLRSHGMTSLTWDRHRGHAWSYDVTALGYNYRIDEIRAALGRVQLQKLAGNNERRRQLSKIYRERLAESVPEAALPFAGHRGISSCHLLPILLPEGSDRTRFMELMAAHGIQTSVHYPPVHRFSFYRQQSSSLSLPLTERIADRQVTLPLYPSLSPALVAIVVRAVGNALQELRQDSRLRESY
jgi:dTDP-4-amino-4,6-dideoxygalactose transaminase